MRPGTETGRRRSGSTPTTPLSCRRSSITIRFADAHRPIRRTASGRFRAPSRRRHTWRRGRASRSIRSRPRFSRSSRIPASFSRWGGARSAAAGFAAKRSPRKMVDRQLEQSKAQFATSPRYAKVDALGGKVSISPIVSWRGAAFIDGVRRRLIRPAQARANRTRRDWLPAAAPPVC